MQNIFRRQSHISVQERFLRTGQFRIGIESAPIAESISKIPMCVDSIGFTTTNNDGKNIRFGDGRIVGWSARDLSLDSEMGGL